MYPLATSGSYSLDNPRKILLKEGMWGKTYFQGFFFT
jgi:hypothetical protein